jgi:ribose-phosphate pyrophosphokinase
VLVGLAPQRIADSPIDKLLITNTIPANDRLSVLKPKLTELCVSGLLGEAIHRIHHNLSVSALFRRGGGTKR